MNNTSVLEDHWGKLNINKYKREHVTNNNHYLKMHQILLEFRSAKQPHILSESNLKGSVGDTRWLEIA